MIVRDAKIASASYKQATLKSLRLGENKSEGRGTGTVVDAIDNSTDSKIVNLQQHKPKVDM